MAAVLRDLRRRYPRFAGVMGWEYFNSLPGGREQPWKWAQWMTAVLGTDDVGDAGPVARSTAGEGDGTKQKEMLADGRNEGEAPLPEAFEYDSDGLGECDD